MVINEMQGNLDEGTSTTTASKKQKPIELKCIGVMGDDWSRNPPPGYAVFMDVSFAKKLQEQYNKINDVDTTNTKSSYDNVSVKAESCLLYTSRCV